MKAVLFRKLRLIMAAVCILAAALFCCGFTKEPLLEVHFIDVGQGDAILVKSGDDAMLIDGGNSNSSDVVYTYLKKQKIDSLKYIVCTHEDEDHVGGLPGAVALLQDRVETVFAPVADPMSSTRFSVLVDILEKYQTRPEYPKIGKTYQLGNARFQIISFLESGGNEGAIVIKLWDGETSFIFAADIPEITERRLINSVYNLKCDVLKVAHHGGSGSSCTDFLKEASPKYAVISVGKNNDYGHPSKEVLERLNQVGAQVLRTDERGSIIFKSSINGLMINEEVLKFSVSQPGVVQEYVLNTHTMKFHYPNCPSVEKINPVNRTDKKDTRKDLIEEGFSPCGICHP